MRRVEEAMRRVEEAMRRIFPYPRNPKKQCARELYSAPCLTPYALR